MIYHYTDKDCLIKILGLHNSQDENINEKNITFHAFSVKSYIGQEELAFNFEDILPYLKEVESEMEIENLFQLSRIKSQCLLTQMNAEPFIDFKHYGHHDPYAISFSANENCDCLWLKHNYCLCLDEQYMYMPSDKFLLFYDKVSYGIEKEKIKSIIRRWYNTYLFGGVFQHNNIYNDIVQNNLEILNSIRFDLFSIIKTPPFQKEEEYRAVCVVGKNEDIVQTNEDGRKYVDIQYSRSVLCKIIYRAETPLTEIKEILCLLNQSGYSAKEQGCEIIVEFPIM